MSLMDGIKRYRDAGRDDLDLQILSAGYGLLDEDQDIVPYEVTFSKMTNRVLKEWSQTLSITDSINQKLKNYDLIFFLLGDRYLQSIQWPLEVEDHQRLIFFAGTTSKKLIVQQPQATIIFVTKKEAALYGSGLIEIKGFLFNHLLQHMITHADISWKDFIHKPRLIRDCLLQALEDRQRMQKLDPAHTYLAFSEFKPQFIVKKGEEAKNYQTVLDYFMPENDDRVDPKFNFDTDEHAENRSVMEDDRYAHDFFDTPQYDGILISKVNIDGATALKRELIQKHGIRKFLHLTKNTKIMGDCGAFSYSTLQFPPYSTAEVLDYYQTMGYDYGVSVDHLIAGMIEKDVAERERRYEITKSNAREFIHEHQKGGFSFTPVGVAQGWDPTSFREAVIDLIKMGYEYIALGGLAKEKSVKILEILREIAPHIPNRNFRMHLFGVAREMEVMRCFHKLGVTSFDSASPLRRAWLDSRHNYYSNSGQTYTAIRIPEANQGKGRFKQVENTAEFEMMKTLELKALELVRSYGKNVHDDLEPTLEAILAYDQHIGGNRNHHAEAYRHLLVDKPWTTCDCPICKQVGIDVVIFRGNNRNRRRGFHNTYVYYQQLLKLKNELFTGQQKRQ